MRSVVRCNCQSFVEGNGSNQNVNFADQHSALFQIRPNISGQNGGSVREWKDAMTLTKPFKRSKPGGSIDGFQSPCHLVITEFGKLKLAELLNICGGV